MTPKMLTPREIADVLQVSYESALAFIRYSGIDYIKIGRSYRVAENKLMAYLQQTGQTCIDLNPWLR